MPPIDVDSRTQAATGPEPGSESCGFISEVPSACSIGHASALRLEQADFRLLSTELPASLLRAVSLQRALAGYGKHWKTSSGSQSGFDLSVQAGAIDEFISHDWATGRIQKFIALCFFYNSKAALIGSTIFVSALVTLRVLADPSQQEEGRSSAKESTDADLLFRSPCTLLTPLVYFALLFHWQTIRDRLLRKILPTKPLVFLDKLCINQDNEEQKQQGILGLATFLKKSNRMLILWSPRYLTRLWCTFELAAWLSLGKEPSAIVFLPIMVPNLVVKMVLVVTIYAVSFQIARYCPSLGFSHAAYGSETLVGLAGCLALVLGMVVTFQTKELQLEFERLSVDLAIFSILDAECLCCSCGHEHPETGAALPCDRRLVYRTLKSWHPSTEPNGASEHVFLSAFDREIRSFVRDVITSLVSSETSQLRYIESLHCALPVLWMALDSGVHTLMEWPQLPVSYALCEVVQGIVLATLIIPCATFLWLRFTARSPRLPACMRERRWCRLLLAALVWSPIWTLLTILLWMPLHICLTIGAVWAQALYGLVLTGLLRYLRFSDTRLLRDIALDARSRVSAMVAREGRRGTGPYGTRVGMMYHASFEPPDNIVTI
eukprot:TRINITY_DN13933_c0_g1_i2.p1 TRINITY_DN13933_c0_g1~~TRINITY_DN13933_c0_g1_i2.p1  ORF type:complete len:606 (+),score=54.03 TRINITY_DN13933_c0_g1_i2:183-2000(+)